MQVTSYKQEKSHKDLLIYQRAYSASLEIYALSKSSPKEEQFGITSQIRRCATSICANIAEGYGRQLSSDKDFQRFLIISKGSCQELFVWLDYCVDLKFLNQKDHEKLINEYKEISRMIHAFIQKL